MSGRRWAFCNAYGACLGFWRCAVRDGEASLMVWQAEQKTRGVYMVGMALDSQTSPSPSASTSTSTHLTHQTTTQDTAIQDAVRRLSRPHCRLHGAGPRSSRGRFPRRCTRGLSCSILSWRYVADLIVVGEAVRASGNPLPVHDRVLLWNVREPHQHLLLDGGRCKRQGVEDGHKKRATSGVGVWMLSAHRHLGQATASSR